MTPEQRRILYHNAVKTSGVFIERANKALIELDKLVYSEDFATAGGVSYDDIDLFSRLRSATIAKDLVWPTKLRNYMDNFSRWGDVPLYHSIAC